MAISNFIMQFKVHILINNPCLTSTSTRGGKITLRCYKLNQALQCTFFLQGFVALLSRFYLKNVFTKTKKIRET